MLQRFYLFFIDFKPLNKFAIEALLPNSTATQTCVADVDVGKSWKKGATRAIQCRSGITGSIVRIRHTGSTWKVLSLCEVQVYGVHGKAVLM